MTSLAPWNLKQPVSSAEAESIISAVARRSLSPAAEAWLRGDDLNDKSPVLSNAYEQVVWVYRAINVLAEQVANIPFLFSRGERGRENLITSGPLLDFYARPHPSMDRFQYWELRLIWLMLRGECFRIPIWESSSSSSSGPPARASSSAMASSSSFSSSSSGSLSGLAGGGSPLLGERGWGEGEFHSALRTPHSALPRSRRLKSVLMLDPASFQHIVDDGRLLGWRYTGHSPTSPIESQVFLPEEVWFDKLPNPFDFWRGMPPLYIAQTPAKTDFAASSFMRGLMENNADVGLIVRTDQQLSKDQRAQIFAALESRKRRAGTADRPLLLWGGAQVVRPELSSADLQFLENRRFSRSEICAAFGVPEEIVATTANSKYDVMAGARQNFIENRIAPLCARLEASENATTIPAILGSSLNPQPSTLNQPVGWFDLDSLPIMQAARRARLASAKLAFDMGIPINEINRALDLGFKPLPWGDDSYLPTKYQRVTKSSSSSSSSSSSGPGSSSSS